MISKIVAIPLSNISLESNNKFIVTGIPALLELKSENCAISNGCVLIEGKILRRGEDFTAHLIIETKTSNASITRISLPTTRNGVFSECIYLPKDFNKLKLEPMQSKGEFELLDLSLKSMGKWEKNFRMFCRVIAFFEKYSFKFCYRAGLRLDSSLFNLSFAYHFASKFKYYASAPDYSDWLKEFDELSDKEKLLINKQISRWTSYPHFVILININELNEAHLKQTLDSLDKQFIRNYSVILVVPNDDHINNRGSNIPDWVEISQPNTLHLKLKNKEQQWIMIVEAGVVFTAHALYWFASIILREPDARFIYSDHDYLERDSRVKPVFKPDWSPELLRSTNYIGPAFTAISIDVILQVVDISEMSWMLFNYHDLFLRLGEQLNANAIKHIPAILGHIRLSSADKHSNKQSVVEHLKRFGISATVEDESDNTNRVIYHIQDYQPLISLIIPTRNGLNFLKPCIESILKLTDYHHFEIIIVDNQSDDQATLDYLDGLKLNSKVKILKYNQPFNYSAINNFAVNECSGEVICLLNNDTEVISAGWLEEMLGHLIQKDVAVVGAKLYFSDERVQHAGDTVGPGGCASHLHSMLERDSAGYCNRARMAQDLSAVTAACLMTWRNIYLQVGGLDEVNLAVAFNDVDYCLKVREAGFRVIWTPYAELYHHESVSRGLDDTRKKARRSKKEANYIRKRWKHLMHHDPFYNPNLSYQRPDFSLSHAPMVLKPWESAFWSSGSKV